MVIQKSKFKSQKYLFWLVPLLAFLPQLLMTLNSFNQVRFEEFYEAVAAPFWFDQRQIINGLHVNVGWYAFLVAVYNIFGFSLHTGKISYLVMAFFSNFALFYLLRRFFKSWVAALILTTITLSPTYLYMNAVNLHWALTFHILIVILVLFYLLDFAKKKLSMVISGAIFVLMMWGWLSYQAFIFYIPSLTIFYLWKLKKLYGSRIKYGMTVMAAFLLPLLMLFVWVDNKHILIADTEVGGGLFRGGGSFNISEQVFVQSWTDFLSDFFVKGVSHHFEVASAEFSLVFPIITLIFMAFALYKIWVKTKQSRRLISLAILIIVFDILVFSTTSDLGLPGMKRVTPLLFSIYFLWILVWYYVDPRFRGDDKRGDGFKLPLPRTLVMVILSLLTIHHLIVYPVNLIHIKDPSPFKVTDWFGEDNPQKKLDEYVAIAKKENLALDCRPIVANLGQCSYDFIYPAVAGSCKWNRLNCHDILGYDIKDNKFVPLSLDLWQNKFFER